MSKEMTSPSNINGSISRQLRFDDGQSQKTTQRSAKNSKVELQQLPNAPSSIASEQVLKLSSSGINASDIHTVQSLQSNIALNAFLNNKSSPTENDFRALQNKTQQQLYTDRQVVDNSPVHPEGHAYYGGYRDKRNNQIYFNCKTQTYRRARRPNKNEYNRFSRDAQTVCITNTRSQAARNTSTQMTKRGVFISTRHDTEITPHPLEVYEESDNFLARRTAAAIVLQVHVRRWLAQKRVEKLRNSLRDRKLWESAERDKMLRLKQQRIMKQYYRRMHPRTRSDFELLYAAVERWRCARYAHICAITSDDVPTRKAALCKLTDEHIELLAAIERHKVRARRENQERFRTQFLTKTAQKHCWIGPDGKATSMSTPFTRRAEQLKALYDALALPCQISCTMAQRLEILLSVKITISEYDCLLTQNLAALIDREVYMLNVNYPVSSRIFDGLRARIRHQLMLFCKTPEFNPEAGRYVLIPPKSKCASVLSTRARICPTCKKAMPVTQFPLRYQRSLRRKGPCRRCLRLRNRTHKRNVKAVYTLMLQRLCRNENYIDTDENFDADAQPSIASFLIDEEDLETLVEKIWNGRSILSGEDDKWNLACTRWNKFKPWAPWNCLIVTKEEAEAHRRLPTLEVYGKLLIEKVHMKHQIALKTFFYLVNLCKGLEQYLPHQPGIVQLQQQAKQQDNSSDTANRPSSQLQRPKNIANAMSRKFEHSRIYDPLVQNP